MAQSWSLVPGCRHNLFRYMRLQLFIQFLNGNRCKVSARDPIDLCSHLARCQTTGTWTKFCLCRDKILWPHGQVLVSDYMSRIHPWMAIPIYNSPVYLPTLCVRLLIPLPSCFVLHMDSIFISSNALTAWVQLLFGTASGILHISTSRSLVIDVSSRYIQNPFDLSRPILKRRRRNFLRLVFLQTEQYWWATSSLPLSTDTTSNWIK